VRPSRPWGLCAAEVGAGRCTALWRSWVALRDVRRVVAATGALDGVEVRFLAAELRPVRSLVARRYEALRARGVLA